jgi:2-hydroxycyclohexanecarboxyl-CoA dehydrogenase
VTGAGSDIGSAVCLALAAMGATVRASDLDRRELAALAERDDRIVTTPADLTSVAEIATLVDGPADIFVSVAGLAHVERFEEIDPERLDLLWRVNLRAPMLLTRDLMGPMVRRGWGRLVYISSESARAGAGGEAAYAATKAGLFGLAKSIAREVAASGVTANVVSPGVIETATSRMLLDSRPGMRDALLRAVPARRLGYPDEVAAAVAYLCSPQSGYVTGQVLSVNGGIAMG